MKVDASDRPTILVSAVSPGGDREKPQLTGLIRELAEAAMSAIESGGANAITVGGDSPEDVCDALEEVDGVVLLGGGDVDPGEYGVTVRHPKLYNIDRATDRMDLEIVRLAVERRMPVLAICRGMHIVNVAYGGTLIQHLEETSVAHRGSNQEPMVEHEVALAKTSRMASIFGQTTITVQSGHHQAVDVIGKGLMTTARTADGTIEALESVNDEVPLVAVQWHPEDRHANAEQRSRLFEWLTEKAREFRRTYRDEGRRLPTGLFLE